MYIKTLMVALFAFVMAACNYSHETEKHDEHQDPKFQYTVYSDDFELFAEADAFVVGETANVLSHFSVLPDFKAVETGTITIVLTVNGKESSQTLEKPTRKGIYSFDIKPEMQGKGTLKFQITNGKGKFEVTVPEVTVFASHDEAHKASEKVVISKTNTTSFTKEQAWKIEFATEYPLKEPFGQVIKTTAQVQSAQGDEKIVAAKTNGIILFMDENVLEGKSVSAGQKMFSISGSELADNNSSVRFSEAQNNYVKTKADYERMQELAKDKIVSGKDLLQAKNDFENAKLIYENLSKNFTIKGQTVTSPMAGFVKQIFIQNGQYVETGQPVVTVSQNRNLLLHADVQQKYASILGSMVSANIRNIQDNKTYSFEELNGKLLSYGKNANNDNFLLPVSIQINNVGNFIPGSFVELYLKTMTNANALTVPNSALLEDQGNYFLFVQINPELFEKREIKIGSTDGFKTEILKGIAQNERIVSKGAILIKLAQATGTLDAHSGHVH
jgi:membrane fusion protein, heavy metal efflux system